MLIFLAYRKIKKIVNVILFYITNIFFDLYILKFNLLVMRFTIEETMIVEKFIKDCQIYYSSMFSGSIESIIDFSKRMSALGESKNEVVIFICTIKDLLKNVDPKCSNAIVKMRGCINNILIFLHLACFDKHFPAEFDSVFEIFLW